MDIFVLLRQLEAALSTTYLAASWSLAGGGDLLEMAREDRLADAALTAVGAGGSRQLKRNIQILLEIKISMRSTSHSDRLQTLARDVELQDASRINSQWGASAGIRFCAGAYRKNQGPLLHALSGLGHDRTWWLSPGAEFPQERACVEALSAANVHQLFGCALASALDCSDG